MTAQEFHKLLEEKRYSYTYEDNITIINHEGNVYLELLNELPDNTIFNNKGNVDLSSLKVLPDNTIFNNKGNVYLPSLKVLPDNIIFNNNGSVDLYSLKTLPDNIIINNNDNVYLDSLKEFNEDFKNINKIILNNKKVFAIIAEFEILINYLYNTYNIDYINKINNRYYVHTK